MEKPLHGHGVIAACCLLINARQIHTIIFKITICYFPKQARSCQKKTLYPVMQSTLNLNVPIDVFKHPAVWVSTSDLNQTSML